MAIVFWPGCDAINFEINIIFVLKPFFYATQKSRQKLETAKSF